MFNRKIVFVIYKKILYLIESKLFTIRINMEWLEKRTLCTKYINNRTIEINGFNVRSVNELSKWFFSLAKPNKKLILLCYII